MKIQPLKKYQLQVINEGKDKTFLTPDNELYEPYFLDYTKKDYEYEAVISIEPMTAKELDLDKTNYSNRIFMSNNYYAEEKLDGTRATLHIGNYCSRVFSRNISTKTDWFTENTDSLPQLRSLCSREYTGTIIDGELCIPDRPFKDVASTLNCLWKEAIYRQTEIGFIVLNAFDITHYKGEEITGLPLEERKKYLQEVVCHLHSLYVREIKFFDTYTSVNLPANLINSILNEYNYKIEAEESLRYPRLTELLLRQLYEQGKNVKGDFFLRQVDKMTFYEYVIATGGEGIILKSKSSIYEHKRSRAYLKVKKNFTREVIITGFSKATKEYQGKQPDTWTYWENTETGEMKNFDWEKIKDVNYFSENEPDLIPISKYYAENWVGNIKFGVIITDDEMKTLSKKKTFIIQKMRFGKKVVNVIEVGECSGFDEATRHIFSSQYIDFDGDYVHCKTEEEFESAEQADLQNIQWEGKVIEVIANELFKDTGRLRHPRYYRLRQDKDPLSCIWKDYLNTKQLD